MSDNEFKITKPAGIPVSYDALLADLKRNIRGQSPLVRVPSPTLQKGV